MVRSQGLVGSDSNYSNISQDEARKTEGLLSFEEAKCCLSWNRVQNSVTEMAQEDNSPCWNNLPSVILLEIFSYLPHKDKIRTSQVCRNWRCALFHPCFWKRITFVMDKQDQNNLQRAQFLANCFGRSLREATIKCGTAGASVEEISRLLTQLSTNIWLHKLYLEPNSCTFEWPIHRIDVKDEGSLSCTPLVRPLLNIVKTTNCLQALSLGCSEDLAASIGHILEPLQRYHAKHLTHLSLASVKDDPDDYILLELDTTIFGSFTRLSVLTIDYDYVSDTLLKSLDSGLMERLVIHVHGLEDNHPGTSNNAWISFVQKNPRCQLRLNLLHSYDAVTILHSDILQPAMPLAELKVLFCEAVNVRALDLLSGRYSNSLTSIIWIDSVDTVSSVPVTYEPGRPDPLVLIAWTCTKLTELVFIGYKYFQNDLLAIARLRGSTLKRLDFAARDIISEIRSEKTVTNEIQKIMDGCWQPLTDDELPLVVMDPLIGDSTEVIMPMVLGDQK